MSSIHQDCPKEKKKEREREREREKEKGKEKEKGEKGEKGEKEPSNSRREKKRKEKKNCASPPGSPPCHIINSGDESLVSPPPPSSLPSSPPSSSLPSCSPPSSPPLNLGNDETFIPGSPPSSPLLNIIPPPSMGDTEAVFSREQLIQEVLSSEDIHVQNLKYLLDYYLIPIRNGGILSQRDIQSLFCNIEVIYNWHYKFLTALRIHTGTGDTLGDIFIDMMPVLRQLYIQYNENYEHAIQTYEVSKKNKLFGQLLEKAQGEANKDLLSYLYLPIQRMISYYSILKDLIAATPTHHEDYDYLCFALEAIRLASNHGQNRADHRKNIDKVLQIQESLSDGRHIAVPHRKFIFEGDVSCYEPSKKGEIEKERRLFLFNDLLLVTKPKKDHKFLLKAVEPLETLRVEEVPGSTAEERYRFRIESSSASYTFASEKKSLWIRNLTVTIRECQSSRYKHAQLQPGGGGGGGGGGVGGGGGGGGGKRPLHSFEESSREYLITRILRWSRMDDADDVLEEVQSLALTLEKYIAVDSV